MTSRQRGFALLIVLWTVGFLALLGTRIVAAGRSDTQLASNLKQDAVLQAAADGAVSDAVFRVLAARDMQPDGQIRERRIGQTPVLVRVESETDRVNLNTATPALLRALIISVGGPSAMADRLATAIFDWHTGAGDTSQDAALGPRYRAAGLAYGPPGTPFQSIAELADVLGMTPELFDRLAPHLTVLTHDDPDMATRDPVVARALADAAGVAAVTGAPRASGQDEILRVTATAMGAGNARYSLLVVASANFQATPPAVNILLRQQIPRDSAADLIASGRTALYASPEN